MLLYGLTRHRTHDNTGKTTKVEQGDGSKGQEGYRTGGVNTNIEDHSYRMADAHTDYELNHRGNDAEVLHESNSGGRETAKVLVSVHE